MHFDTILFDLSGTLVNYRGPAADWPAMERRGLSAVYERLRETNGQVLPPEEAFATHCFEALRRGWYAALSGDLNLKLDGLIRESCIEQGLELAPEVLTQIVSDYTAAISASATLRLGVAETLATLKQQGRRIGLISNTMWPPSAHTDDLKRFGIEHYFDVLIYSAEHGHWKPGQRVFQMALTAVGGEAARAVYVGDNPVDDVQGAQGAGMRAVWIRTNEYPAEAGASADAVIQEMPALLDVLALWEG